MNKSEIESLGFIVINDEKCIFDGQHKYFYKSIDHGHIIEGHDTTQVFLTKEDSSLITIEIDHRSSYDYGDKKVVFKGRCKTIDFLKEILDSVLMS